MTSEQMCRRYKKGYKNRILMHWVGYIRVEGDKKQGLVLEAIVLVRNYREWNRLIPVKKESGGNERILEDINISSFSGK